LVVKATFTIPKGSTLQDGPHSKPQFSSRLQNIKDAPRFLTILDPFFVAMLVTARLIHHASSSVVSHFNSTPGTGFYLIDTSMPYPSSPPILT